MRTIADARGANWRAIASPIPDPPPVMTTAGVRPAAAATALGPREARREIHQVAIVSKNDIMVSARTCGHFLDSRVPSEGAGIVRGL